MNFYSRRKYFYPFIFIGLSYFQPIEVNAKPVELKWSIVKGAVKYEMEIIQRGKTLFYKKTNDTKYLADLQPGAYTYRFRAIDKSDRGGYWSQNKDLIVTAPAPKVDTAEIPLEFEYMGDFPGLSLKWKKVDSVEKYQVTIRSKETGKLVFQKETSDTKIKIEQIPPGGYEYLVSSLVESKGKKFESKGSKLRAIFITKKNVDAPEGLYPEGNVLVGDNPRVKLEWKKVPGAERYEVSLEPIDERGPASEPKKWTIEKNKIEVAISSTVKKYRFKVRALAGNSGVSQQSTSEFFPVEDTLHDSGVGSLSAGLTNLQYFGRISGPAAGSRGGEAVGMGWGYRLNADYWFARKLGVELQFDRFSFSNYSIGQGTAMLKTRWRFSNNPDDWTFSFKFGYGFTDYLVAIGGEPRVSSFTGVSGELSAQKALSDDYDFNLGLSYFMPLASVEGFNIVRFFENQTVRAFIDISHRMTKSLYAAIGMRYELRKSSTGSSFNPDQFYSSNVSFDASIKYKFGNVSDKKVSDLMGANFREIANVQSASTDPLKSNHGVLEVGGGIMPFSVTTVSGTNTTTAAGTSYRNGVRAEYWIGKYDGVSADFVSNYYLIGSTDRNALEFTALYNRREFVDAFGGFVVIGKAGVGNKSWLNLNASGSSEVRTGIGPVAELEFRKLFGNLMISLLGQYQFPSIGVARMKAHYPIYKGVELGVEGFAESQYTVDSSTAYNSRSNMGVLGVLRYRFGVTY